MWFFTFHLFNSPVLSDCAGGHRIFKETSILHLKIILLYSCKPLPDKRGRFKKKILCISDKYICIYIFIMSI